MLRCQAGILVSIRSLESITNLTRARDISGWAVATFNCKLLSREKASRSENRKILTQRKQRLEKALEQGH
jgi:hypothetical protein